MSGNVKTVTSCAKNPYHILSMERPSTNVSEYTLSRFVDPIEYSMNQLDFILNWQFDRYHYCPADGSLLMPFYAFNCNEFDEVPR